MAIVNSLISKFNDVLNISEAAKTAEKAKVEAMRLEAKTLFRASNSLE